MTERIRLLTYLAVLPYRNPLLTAKAAATVDMISGGRFILGVGTGYLKTEFFALGVDFDERNALFDEALDVMPLHWSGEKFSYDGKHFSARDLVARPSPAGQIPIWIGGNAKITRRRVATRAQGWMPMTGSSELFATTRTAQLADLDDVAAAVRELKEMAGDRADEIDILMIYTDPSIVDPTADVDRHYETLGRMRDAGATWVAFAFDFTAQAETIDFVEGFGATYLGNNRI